MSTLFGKRKKRKRGLAPVESESVSKVSSAHEAHEEEEANKMRKKKEVEEPWKHARSFLELGLAPSLVNACRLMGFKKPTPVQRQVIPRVLQGGHVLAMAPTGSGKTATYALPILHRLLEDPYGIFAVVLSPTRELAVQVHEQICAFGASTCNVRCVLVTGGIDNVRQCNELARHPHVVVATPGRLGYILRGPSPPNLTNVRFLVLDEADRLLAPGTLERDVAEVILSTSPNRNNTSLQHANPCQTLLFSATKTGSLEKVSRLAAGGNSSLPLQMISVQEDFLDTSTDSNATDTANDNDANTEATIASRVPSGLRQEYIFMPSKVRDAYVVATIRALVRNQGRRQIIPTLLHKHHHHHDDDEEEEGTGLARSTIIFVSKCEKAGRLHALLTELGMDCICLHGMMTQDLRREALAKFKSHHVRMMVATDVASRGLDIPEVDLVINAELPLQAEDYVHRVGRTARAGRRGRAVTMVGERDVALVHAAEKITKKTMDKCTDVTDEDALKVMSSVTKASRLAKLKLIEEGFDKVVKRHAERRAKQRKGCVKAKQAAQKAAKNSKK